MFQTYCNLELKQGRYSPLKQCCAKSMLLQDCIRVQFFLVFQTEFDSSPFRLILVAIGPFGFSIFSNLIFGCRTIFGNLDFIQNFNYQICNKIPKGYEKSFYFFYSLVFIICFWLIAYVASRYFGILNWK